MARIVPEHVGPQHDSKHGGWAGEVQKGDRSRRKEVACVQEGCRGSKWNSGN